MKRITDAQIIKMYEKKAGNVSATCAALNISRRAFYNRKERSKNLVEKLDEIDESLIDFSESKLLEQIGEGNLTAIIFHLKTKGKNRGYIETSEHDVKVSSFEEALKGMPDEPED